MTLKEGLFTVAEDDMEQELFVVAEYDATEVIPLPGEGDSRAQPIEIPFRDGEENVAPEANDKPKSWRETKDVKQFVQFLNNEMNRIGKPNAMRTLTEKERGLGQLKQLNSYISQALRGDYDSILDINTVDDARNRLEQHIDMVENALFGAQKMQQQRKKMRRRGDDDPDMVKEGGAPHLGGMQIVISAFERAIVGALLNGRASGGRDIEELYADAKSQYSITAREELAIFQILADMGMPTFKDRLRFGKDEDPSREDGFGEWQSQYHA